MPDSVGHIFLFAKFVLPKMSAIISDNKSKTFYSDGCFSTEDQWVL